MISTSITVKANTAALVIIALNGCGASSDSAEERPNFPWYANGYVIDQIVSYDASGAVNETRSCEWVALARELRCDILVIPEVASLQLIWLYNSDGRLQRATTSEDQAIVEIEDRNYQNGKISNIRSVEIPAMNFVDITQYQWHGDSLVALSRYQGSEQNPAKELFESDTVVWNEDRLQVREQHQGSAYTSSRYEFNYGDNNRIETLKQLRRSTATGPWELHEIETMTYDNNGNISVDEDRNALGQQTYRTTVTWQYVGEAIENISLTRGRSHFY